MNSITVVVAAILLTVTTAVACENPVKDPNGKEVCLDSAMEWIRVHCPDAKGSVHGDENGLTADCNYQGPDPSDRSL